MTFQIKNNAVATKVSALSALVLLMVPMVSAQTLFSEDFSTYAGAVNNTQGDTGLDVAVSGTVTGWSNSGAGTMHAVDLGGGDWAIMFFQDNVITLTNGIAANQAGVTYNVEFDYGTAVYSGLSQKTEATDGLLVEVLRGDDSVLASTNVAPGAWSNPSNVNFSAGLEGGLVYTGDGSGTVRLRIGPTPPLNSGRFEGEIDNITVSVNGAVFWTAPGTAGITATSAVATATVNTNLTGALLVWDATDQGTASTNDWTYTLSLGPTNAGAVSAEMTGLTPDTVYAWRFYGISDSGDGWSAVGSVVTALGAGQAPDFTAAVPGVGSIALAWTDNASNETAYLLQRSASGAVGPYDAIATLPAGTVAYTDISLSAGDYHYRLAATNAVNGSATPFVNSQTNATVATAAVFTETFDGIAGIFNGTQFESGNALAVNASLAGWTPAGAGAIHAVNHDGAGNLAPMLWGGNLANEANILTLTAGIPDSNVSGQPYELDFIASPSVYEQGPQASSVAEGVLVEVLRGDNSVLASHTALPGAWAGDMAFVAESLQYIGDGSGDIRLRLSPSNPGVGRFGAAVDTLVLSTAAAGGLLLVNDSASDVHLRTATLNATLAAPGTNVNVSVYWGTTDGGTNAAAWDRSANLGTWGNVSAAAIHYDLNLLSPDTEYFYTFRAVNAATNIWASPSTRFSTLPQIILTEDFNSYSGNQNDTQAETGLSVAHSGDITGWSKSGSGTMHAVNLDGSNNWAIMFFQNNVITLTTGVPGNSSGVTYRVAFDYGAAVYAGTNQATASDDGLLVEVLRGNNSVLASTNVVPGAWGSGNYNLDAGLRSDFSYTGDGSGDVRLRIGPTPPHNTGRFEGEIDNLSLTVPELPPPTGVMLIVR